MKRIIVITMSFLVFLVGTIMSVRFVYADATTKDVFFITDTPEDWEICAIQKKYSDIANGIATIENMDVDKLVFGDMFTVIGDESLYYIPIFYNDKCIYIVRVYFEDNANVSVIYGEAFCGIINELDPGTYYFQKINGIVYLVGKNKVYVIENKDNKDYSERHLPTYNDYDNEKQKKMFFTKNKIISARSIEPRSVLYKDLTTLPHVNNYGGNGTGCCWLSSAMAICRYYGNTQNINDVHNHFHGDHYIAACPGGTIQDGLAVLQYCINKSGTITSNDRTPSKVYSSIYNNIPIYTSWSYQDSAGNMHGHAMVICGYLFDNTSGSFTYIIMDPNENDRQYIVTTFSSNGASYGEYSWIQSIYDLQ